MPKKKKLSEKISLGQTRLFNDLTLQDVFPNAEKMESLTTQDTKSVFQDTNEELVRQYWSVSEVTLMFQECLNADPILGNKLTVKGELSNLKSSSRGHVYLTLKDESASMNAVIWASTSKCLPFSLENGLEVYATGELELYPPNGTYSLVIRKIEPVGVGSLQLAFQQIKAKLEAEGLFQAFYKQDLPLFPLKLGIVTSPTGAVIHDMLRVIRRKNSHIDVLIAPAKVQGEGAAHEIATAIETLNQPVWEVDLIIVARGGGSFEDLFCFSEEAVVRAIFNSKIPIITGLGHEPDYSLADATADFSASTPTAAAERAVPDTQQILKYLIEQHAALQHRIIQLIDQGEQQLDIYAQNLENRLYRVYDSHSQQLVLLRQQLIQIMQNELCKHENSLFFLEQNLNAFHPQHVLERGFITAKNIINGRILTKLQELTPGMDIQLSFQDGEALCQVIKLLSGEINS